MTSNETFRHDDLKVLSILSRSLWTDPGRSQTSVLETFSAVLLQNLTAERAIEKASHALLERAKKGGNAKNSQSNLNVLLHPFYRLDFEERMILVALHLGKWSYSRVARILKGSPEKVQESAWLARLRLLSHGGASIIYPAGAPKASPYCPEYSPNRPWTQRYLDQEVASGRERLFLQSHLLACKSCNDCFLRCREIYYRVEKEILQSVGTLEEIAGSGADSINAMREVLRQTKVQMHPARLTLRESLSVFAMKPDITWTLLGLIVWIGFLILRSLRP